MSQAGPVAATVVTAPPADDASGPPYPVGAPTWRRGDVQPEDWRIALSPAAQVEILDLATALHRAPLPLYLRTASQFRLEACRCAFDEARRRVLGATGFAVIDRLPEAVLEVDTAKAVFWVLGQLFSRQVATKWNGALLYDVADTGRTAGRGVRGSATRVELGFHNDNAFGLALPDQVGLLCLRPATTGGLSRVCSLYAVHDDLLGSAPRLLQRLYQPLLYDRQGEHAASAPEILAAPMFTRVAGRLKARLTPNLVRRGYAMAGRPLDDALSQALDRIEALLAEPDRAVQYQLERGQIQFVHNHACAHYRSAFEDDPRQPRHLVRAWYRTFGDQTYDG